MAVYTQVARHELSHLLEDYQIGELIEFTGIGAGSENTNYFVSTTQGEFVLTLFERVAPHELPYYNELNLFLADRGVPCAAPTRKSDGTYVSEVRGKPAVIVPRLPGRSVTSPTATHCFEVGQNLANLHQLGYEFPSKRDNPFTLIWYRQALDKLHPKIDLPDRQLIQSEINFQVKHETNGLPAGLIHADLFVDNVLIEDNTVSGIIDFYYACQDSFLLDIAIALNDWCRNDNYGLDPGRKEAFLSGYQKVREFSAPERDHFPVIIRLAALRFWISRLLDFHFPRSGHLVKTKNPKEFQHILEHHIDNTVSVAYLR